MSISTVHQSEDNNCTRMEHLSLLTITIGSKYLAISIARLGDNIIVNYNQSSAFIYGRGNGAWDLTFGSRKVGNNEFGFQAEPG